MRVLKEEMKYLLCSPFLHALLLLGVVGFLLAGGAHEQAKAKISISNRYVDRYGTSFGSQEDAERLQAFILEETPQGKAYKAVAKKYHLPMDPEATSSILQSYMEEEKEAPDYLWEADELAFELRVWYSSPQDLLEAQKNAAKTDTVMVDYLKSSMKGKGIPQWEQELIFTETKKAYDAQLQQIRQGKDIQYLAGMDTDLLGIAGFDLSSIWFLAIFAAFVTAARGIAGSFAGNRQEILFSTRTGRNLLWYKLLGVVLVTAGFILLLSALVIGGYWLGYLGLYRYLGVPVGAFLADSSHLELFRVSVSFGEYLLILTGIGTGIAVIMALLFCGVMIVAKRSTAGAGAAAITGGILTVVSMIFGAKTLFIASSPISLMNNGGSLLHMFDSFPFTGLPHFEGISLLAWGLLFGIFLALAAVRFRKTAL